MSMLTSTLMMYENSENVSRPKTRRYHQPDNLTKPSSSKEIVANRIKISASAAEDFTDEVSDSGDLIEAKRQASPSESELKMPTIQPLKL